jgi:hypothetical protein
MKAALSQYPFSRSFFTCMVIRYVCGPYLCLSPHQVLLSPFVRHMSGVLDMLFAAGSGGTVTKADLKAVGTVGPFLLGFTCSGVCSDRFSSHISTRYALHNVTRAVV